MTNSATVDEWIPQYLANNSIAKEYYSHKHQCREDRIRFFNVVFYNFETGQSIPPYLRYQHNNIVAKPTNNTVRSLKDQSFMRRRKIQRLILHKHWIKHQGGTQAPEIDKMIQETKQELSATIF